MRLLKNLHALHMTPLRASTGLPATGLGMRMEAEVTMQHEAKMTGNTTTKVNRYVHAEVRRLLACEPRGLSAGGMARISRLPLASVAAALAELERTEWVCMSCSIVH